MATITRTTLQLYKGTSASGEKVGNDIVDTTAGGPQTITLDYESLGAFLNAGEQYFTRVKVLNDEGFESDWNDPDAQKAFITLILAEIITLSGSNGNLNVDLSFTYNNQVLSIQDCGVYVSTNASGENAQKISAGSDEAAAGQWQITTLEENRTYYVIPYVVDNVGEGREYKPEWSEAGDANTGYRNPVVMLEQDNVETTYNEITGAFTVTTNDTLSNVYLSLQTSGGTLYRFDQTASTGTQFFTITNGMDDSNGEPVVITPNTDYTIKVYATNTSGGNTNKQVTVTTKPQGTSTITITSVVPMPTSATVNLSYNNNAPVVNPDEQQ